LAICRHSYCTSGSKHRSGPGCSLNLSRVPCTRRLRYRLRAGSTAALHHLGDRNRLGAGSGTADHRLRAGSAALRRQAVLGVSLSWKATARLRLPEATAELIASLGEHRILSTTQVRAIHFSDRSSRRAQQILAYLERAGLVAYVEARRAPRRLYFLTERGADLAIDAGEVERRPKVLNPEQAAGPLCAHTIGVNEVGISFLHAARERGDEFGPLSWRHEVAHPLNRGRGRARRSLIADAVLSYVRVDERHLIYEQRFVEVDRATLSVERLVAELARYGQLCRAHDKRAEPLWRSHYPSFPPVICALAGASRKALVRRRDITIALLNGHPDLERAYGTAIHFCLLDDLMSRGPFAPIFRTVGEEGQSNWLGEGEDRGKVGARADE
jgi:Replication-relaxation